MSGYGIELLNEDGAVVAGPADLFAMAAPFLHALIGSDIFGLKLRYHSTGCVNTAIRRSMRRGSRSA